MGPIGLGQESWVASIESGVPGSGSQVDGLKSRIRPRGCARDSALWSCGAEAASASPGSQLRPLKTKVANLGPALARPGRSVAGKQAFSRQTCISAVILKRPPITLVAGAMLMGGEAPPLAHGAALVEGLGGRLARQGAPIGFLVGGARGGGMQGVLSSGPQTRPRGGLGALVR